MCFYPLQIFVWNLASYFFFSSGQKTLRILDRQYVEITETLVQEHFYRGKCVIRQTKWRTPTIFYADSKAILV